MSNTENTQAAEAAPAPETTTESVAPPADTSQVDAPPPETAPQAETAPETAADSAEQTEPAATPLETAQDQDQAAQEGAESAEKQKETLTLGFDAAQIEALTADLKAHLDDGFAQIKAEFGEKMGELAEHCEKRIDALAESLASADIAKIEVLVGDAQAAVKAIQESGVAALAGRLTSLEMKLRHSL